MSKYIPVTLSSFIGGKEVAVDVFLKESESYSKVLTKGQTFDRKRLEKYTGGKIETVYLLMEDYSAYVETCVPLAQLVQDQNKLTGLHRFSILSKIAEAVFTEISLFGLTEKNYLTLDSVLSRLYANVSKEMGFTDLLGILNQIGDDYTRHSISVGSISVRLAFQMDQSSERTIKILGVAGTLHDIGFKDLPMNLVFKTRQDMSASEVQQYESHPENASRILSAINVVPSEVTSCVLDHHEETNGTGFPRKLKLDRIFALSRVIYYADFLSHHLIRSETNPEPKNPKEAIAALLQEKGIVKSDFQAAMFALAGIADSSRSN